MTNMSTPTLIPLFRSIGGKKVVHASVYYPHVDLFYSKCGMAKLTDGSAIFQGEEKEITCNGCLRVLGRYSKKDKEGE